MEKERRRAAEAAAAAQAEELCAVRRRLTGTSTRRLTRRGRVIGPKSRSRRLDWYIDTQRLLSEAEAEAEGLRARVAELEARGQARGRAPKGQRLHRGKSTSPSPLAHPEGPAGRALGGGAIVHRHV